MIKTGTGQQNIIIIEIITDSREMLRHHIVHSDSREIELRTGNRNQYINKNRTLGTSAIGGMLIGMILQIFIVPALFVAFQYLQEKVKPMEWEDVDNSDAEPEIEQYTK